MLHVFADDLDTVGARMRQAEGIAHEAGLLVLNATIHPPHSSAGLPEPSLPGTSPPAAPRKEAAYVEAAQTVADARRLEVTAHERLLAGLRANSAGLEAIGLHAEWGRAAATATSPAAIGLAGMAMALDEWAAGATRALFEKAVAQDGFAVEAKGELARFQEGLRATHEGEPSHNTVLGHSYGSTVAGYAARDHGMATDEIVFLGSPGVGVEHARELGVPPEHVWSGTSGDDVIDHATPSLDPRDFFDGEDDHWFGMNPSDPHFGARSLETDPDGGHTDYWDRRTSLESMARVVAGVEKGHP
ncbi:alpha/beta hydrolase family protein [Saccharopolyspora gregorii]|uniref:alpha/beta hydrolase family protein n=1 Tax=Saccharopolyspora gregorii TaxID=33914 RepID=UPI0021ABA00F|nr:alpha/beta hydrolase family protein [Saccharopolyspora gregorii]